MRIFPIICFALTMLCSSPVASQMQATSDRTTHLAINPGEEAALIGKMLRTRIDFSWIFEPVLLKRIEPSADDRAKTGEIIGMARFARVKGLPLRPDVQTALTASETIILAEAARRNLIDSIVVSDADVIARIAEHPGRYDEYRLSHIFITVGSSPKGKARTDQEALALANQVHARIKAGTAFAEVAEKLSEDADTAVHGGILPTMKGVTMNPLFLDHVGRLPELAVTPPVRGPDGYHLIRLESRTVANTRSARFWVEQDVIHDRLPTLIANALESGIPSRVRTH